MCGHTLETQDRHISFGSVLLLSIRFLFIEKLLLCLDTGINLNSSERENSKVSSLTLSFVLVVV